MSAAIDPEALIALTVARGDLRLIHETVDWGVQNASALLVPRIRKYALEVGAQAEAESWIATVSGFASGVAWSPRAPAYDAVQPSGKSAPMELRGAAATAAAAIRFRAYAGTHLRSEVIRAFHPVVLGLHGPRTSSEIAWHALAAKSQVNAVLDELVRRGYLERHGTERRRTYEPRSQLDDLFGSSAWVTWERVAYAPWRAATAALAHLDEILVITGTDDSRSATVEAVAHHRSATAYLERIDSSLARPSPTGSAVDVLGELRVSALDTAGRLVRLLVDGHDATRGLLAAALRVPRDPVSGSNPWQGFSKWTRLDS